MTVAKNAIKVLSRHYEPYMYLNVNGSFEKGIEFNLMKVIEKKLGRNIDYLNYGSALVNENLSTHNQ